MDILSALNKNGSGLNISELATSLADADIVPRKSLVQERIDTAELRLSGYDRLRAQLDTFSEALTMMRGLSPRNIRSDNPAVSVALADPAAVDTAAASITVDRLATSQVLSFRGFSGPDQPVGGGALTIETGSWSDADPAVFNPTAVPAQTLNFAADSTLATIAAQLDALEGINARVVDLGDGTFALGVISQTGRDNALRFSAPAGSGLAQFDFSADPASVQVQQAQNAELRLNGIAVTRPANQITDLLPGVALSLQSVSTQPANIAVNADTEGTLTVMQGFVDIINATRRLVDEMTGRTPVADGGKPALGGDAVALDAVRMISALIARGFGASDVHLAQIGIKTERDGTLTLDDAAFTAALTANPAILDPLLRDDLRADTISVTGLPRSGVPEGTFTFQRDPQTGQASVNGVAVFGNQTETGDWEYRVATGPLRGTTLLVPADTDRATITYYPSMLNTLQSYLTSSTSQTSALADREATLRRTITDENLAVEQLSSRQENLRERYLAQFTQMEQIVSQLNSTSAYLTNLVDGWNAKK